MIRAASLSGIVTLLTASIALAATPLPVATFAGGCFWSMQRHFDSVPGVTATLAGYTGGSAADANYDAVSGERTGHAEAIEVTYDPAVTNYEKLLQSYWHYIDPTAKDAQFCDVGPSYRTAIYTHGADQKRLAEASLAAIEASGRFKGETIETRIVDAPAFYPAEAYHQEFYKKNPVRYTAYRLGCGRDPALKKIWGDDAGAH